MPDFQQITLSALAVIIILDKFGILNKLPFLKNGNGVKEKMEKLEEHFNHEITDELKEIKELLKEILENTIIIKTKQNGK